MWSIESASRHHSIVVVPTPYNFEDKNVMGTTPFRVVHFIIDVVDTILAA